MKRKNKSKILTSNTALKINGLISSATGRKREILIELKSLNNKAENYMKTPNARYGNKYTLLQDTKMWRDAKKLILEYFDNTMSCKMCGKQLDHSDCIMHHSFYCLQELFSPQNITFLHDKCHEKVHEKGN